MANETKAIEIIGENGTFTVRPVWRYSSPHTFSSWPTIADGRTVNGGRDPDAFAVYLVPADEPAAIEWIEDKPTESEARIAARKLAGEIRSNL